MSTENKWENLRSLLEEKDDWPGVYLYKFIVKNEESKINEIKALFAEGEISTNFSKNGSYVSISIKEIMSGPDAIIERYKKMDNIEGVLSL